MTKLFQVEPGTGEVFEVSPEVYLGTAAGSRRGFALDDPRLWDDYQAAVRQLAAARAAMECAGRPIANTDLTPTAQRILQSVRKGKR